VPANLLVFALQAGITTLTCLAEVSSWTVIGSAQRQALYQLYVPYLALCKFSCESYHEAVALDLMLILENMTAAVVMGLDMYQRLGVAIGVPGDVKKRL
jgi:hypothetical protein